MKDKIINIVLLSLVLVFCLSAFSLAAPCYGTRLPGKRKIVLGVQTYSVFKRGLEKDSGKLRSQQEFLLLSYGPWDWLSIDLKGGAGFIKQRLPASDELDYPSFLGGGYGFRIRFLNRQKVKAVFGFQHISVHPYTINLGEVKHKAVLDDWQFSLLGSYEFKRITPYAGARWSRLDYIHWTNDIRSLVQSALGKSAGFIFGCDIPVSARCWLNLEGQFFDSEALAFSLNYSF